MSGLANLRGISIGKPASSADMRADPYPLPPRSLRPDPLTDLERSNIAGRFAIAVISICFLVPMILAGIMMRFH